MTEGRNFYICPLVQSVKNLKCLRGCHVFKYPCEQHFYAYNSERCRTFWACNFDETSFGEYAEYRIAQIYLQ